MRRDPTPENAKLREEVERLRTACQARVDDWDSCTVSGAAAEGCPDPQDVALCRAALCGDSEEA